MNTKVISLSLTAFIFLSGSVSFSALGNSNPSAAVELHNQFCPISGEKVSPSHSFVYEGKKIGICCPGCDQKFKQNPDFYFEKMREREPEIFTVNSATACQAGQDCHSF